MNKQHHLVIAICILSLLTFNGCSKAASGPTNAEDTLPQTRIIKFSGYRWDVRTSDENQQGPGPNYFSDAKQNVWVDTQGQLHLKITLRNGKWYCAGVTLHKVYEHAKYVFQIGSPLNQMDKNVVGALFLYKNDEQEIDIEFSKWSKGNNENAQFVLQPGDKAGNKNRYSINQSDPVTVHSINWQEGSVGFASYYGSIADTTNPTNFIKRWTYTGADNPTDMESRVKINLWLFKGTPPSDQNDQELIISKFKIL